MIKKLFTLGLVLAAFAGNAQQFKTNLIKKYPSKSSLKTMHTARVTSASDSVMVTACNDATDPNVTLYGGYPIDNDNVIDSGFFFGTGYIPEPSQGYTIYFTESAQKYTISGSAHITDVIFLAGSAYSSAATSTIVSNVYAMGATTKAPSTLLGTSASMPLQSVSTANYNDMVFSTPVAISNQSFYVSVTAPLWHDATHDTLSIALSDLGTCPAVGDSTSWVHAVGISGTVTVGSLWQSVENGIFGGQANADLAIYPVVDITTAGISKVTKAGMSLFAASPNPTNSNININFSVEKSSTVEIEVYDISGKVVKSIKNSNAVAGKNAISIDVTNLQAGSYMYSINANGNKMFSKFIVTK